MNDLGQWRELLDLVKRLMAQPTLVAQRDLLLDTTRRLLGGDAELWLSDSLRRSPGAETLSMPPQPPTPLARRALRSGELILQEAAMAMSLRAADVTLGVLAMERPGDPAFDEDEVALFRGLVAQASAALQAGRQVAEERWRLEQLSLVRTVSAEVADVLDLDELARRVTRQIQRTFGYYHVALFTWEPGREELRCRASIGSLEETETVEEIISAAPAVRIGEGIVGHVAQANQEIWAGDVKREPHYRHVDVLPETRSEAALPLRVEGRVLGVLDVQSDQPERFDETDKLVLRALADQVAIAVEDARLYSALRRRADQLSTVAQVSRAVASILDLDELLDRVVTLIHEQFGYPFVHLFTVDQVRQTITYQAGWPSDELQEGLGAGGLTCSLDATEGIVAWVACHGETVMTNDRRRDPHHRDAALSYPDANAQLAVPLIFGDDVLGVLNVQSDRPEAFSDDDRFLFEALADSVAIAIRNANLYRSERWRRKVADSLRDVAGLLSAGVDVDQVLDAILTELDRLLPCDAAAIWLLNDQELCLSAVRGYASDLCIGDLTLDHKSWMHQALIADQPLVRGSSSPPEPLGSVMDFPSDYSAIAAALRAGDRRLGLLSLVHHTPERYGSESRAMTAAFASYAAVAIENARLYQRAQEQAYISTVLLQVAEATQSLTTLDEVLNTVVRLMPMLVGVDRCALLLWDETEAVFEPAVACGLDADQQRLFDHWRFSLDGDDARLHRGLQPISLECEMADETMRRLGFASPLLLPLLAHGEVEGAMVVNYEGQQNSSDLSSLSGDRLTIIRGIAYQAATAIENTRLLEAQQEEAYVSGALLQVARAVAHSNELHEVLEAIVRITPMLVGVKHCTIFLWDEELALFHPRDTYGLSPRAEAMILNRPQAPGDFPLLDHVRESDRMMTVDVLKDREGWVPTEMVDPLTPSQHAGRLALLAVPLSVKDDLLGVMLVGEERAAREIDERRMEIITGIAQQAALAVQNDRLQREMAERERLERELQLARDIQQTFMPERLPQLPNWDLAVVWQAARQVAGDFYDLFELPGRRLGLVIADVADKGMPAALFMALTRTLMRAAASEDLSPADVMARVNDLLVPDAQRGMFVTAVYIVLSLETGEVVYANAGHLPPLILRAEREHLTQLEKGEMALGVMEGIQFHNHTVTLEPGDYVILYTDGITEALSAEGTFYGLDRFRRAIHSQSGRSAQGVLDRVIDHIASFVGETPPSDDLTFMVVQRLG